jgi:hypothetical protein
MHVEIDRVGHDVDHAVKLHVGHGRGHFGMVDEKIGTAATHVALGESTQCDVP